MVCNASYVHPSYVPTILDIAVLSCGVNPNPFPIDLHTRSKCCCPWPLCMRSLAGGSKGCLGLQPQHSGSVSAGCRWPQKASPVHRSEADISDNDTYTSCFTAHGQYKCKLLGAPRDPLELLGQELHPQNVSPNTSCRKPCQTIDCCACAVQGSLSVGSLAQKCLADERGVCISTSDQSVLLCAGSLASQDTAGAHAAKSVDAAGTPGLCHHLKFGSLARK